MLETKFSGQGDDEFDEIGARISGLENELRRMREEFGELREVFMGREKKGAILMDAYKSVFSDIAGLIEAQCQENTKREESLRFFMGSIESRLKNDILSELGIESVDENALANSWWPFKKYR